MASGEHILSHVLQFNFHSTLPSKWQGSPVPEDIHIIIGSKVRSGQNKAGKPGKEANINVHCTHTAAESETILTSKL